MSGRDCVCSFDSCYCVLYVFTTLRPITFRRVLRIIYRIMSVHSVSSSNIISFHVVSFRDFVYVVSVCEVHECVCSFDIFCVSFCIISYHLVSLSEEMIQNYMF